jgi:hypothetical protein
MEETMINVGDRVTVYFERVEAEYNAEVVAVPQKGTYGAWELKRLDGTPVYIQQYSKMIVTKPVKSDSEVPLGAIKGVGTTASVLAAVKAGEGDKKP